MIYSKYDLSTADYSRTENTRKSYEYLARAAYEIIISEKGNLEESIMLLHTGEWNARSTVRYTAPHCTALYCTALHCTALHYTVLYCTALHYTALHCTVLHCTFSASLSLPYLSCLIFSALPSLPHLLCLIFSASPSLSHLLCLTFSASPTLPHLLCLTFSASPSLPHILCLTFSTFTCFHPNTHHMTHENNIYFTINSCHTHQL